MNRTNVTSFVTVQTDFTMLAYSRSAVGMFGLVTNSLNVMVFLNVKLTDTSYNFMLAKSIANIIYVIFSLLAEILTYCNRCHSAHTYLAVVYTNIVSFYLMSCLAMFRILLQLAVSTYTFCILSKRSWQTRNAYIWLLVALGLISVVFYIQKPFMYSIAEARENVYFISPNHFSRLPAIKFVSIFQTFFRFFLVGVLLTFINVFNVIKFRKRFKRFGKSFMILNEQRSSEEDHSLVNTQPNVNENSVTKQGVAAASRLSNNVRIKLRENVRRAQNITRMVIASSFINVFTEMPYSICFVLLTTGIGSKFALQIAITVSVVPLFFSPALDFFIYYFFNKLFKGVFDDYVKRIFHSKAEWV